MGLKTLSRFTTRENLRETVNHYFKDRTENFDDYYPEIQNENECKLLHVHN